ncbi:MAG TPA: GFA family protein [Candidatus Sulfomarinibacteraceae bacterium]|nr:GFA family protein [Candidatus Sulfomarinibacteraceae bacterium]
MADPSASVHEGRCACGHVHYRMLGEPMFVHCCHCSWCQRETGSAFAVNALIEADRVEIVEGEVEVVHTPSASGKGQRISRCPVCRVAMWSNYGGAGDVIRFVRVGTLLEPGRVPPDVHIFTSTKLPWVTLAGDIPVFEEYYSSREQWPEASLERRRAVIEAFKARVS